MFRAAAIGRRFRLSRRGSSTFEEADHGTGVVYGITVLKPEAIVRSTSRRFAESDGPCGRRSRLKRAPARVTASAENTVHPPESFKYEPYRLCGTRNAYGLSVQADILVYACPLVEFLTEPLEVAEALAPVACRQSNDTSFQHIHRCGGDVDYGFYDYHVPVPDDGIGAVCQNGFQN